MSPSVEREGRVAEVADLHQVSFGSSSGVRRDSSRASSKPTAAPTSMPRRASSAIIRRTAARALLGVLQGGELRDLRPGAAPKQPPSSSAWSRIRCRPGAAWATTSCAWRSRSGSVSAATAASTSSAVYVRGSSGTASTLPLSAGADLAQPEPGDHAPDGPDALGEGVGVRRGQRHRGDQEAEGQHAEQVGVVVVGAAAPGEQDRDGPGQQQPERRGVAAEGDRVRLHGGGHGDPARAAREEHDQHEQGAVAALEQPAEDPDGQHAANSYHGLA